MSELSKINDMIDALDKKSQISDGSHTFDDLYFHRCILFAAVCNLSEYPTWRSKLHSDNSMYENYFIVGITTPKGDFSYHFHMDWWDYFVGIDVIEKAHKWDGHTSKDVVEKITSLY